jgi:hypothetical protein
MRFGVSVGISLCAVSVLTSLSAPAQGQTSDPAPTGAVTTGQTVTFEELEGAVIEATVVRRQIIRRDGRVFPVKFQNNVKIVIGADEKFDVIASSVSDTPRGVRKGRTISGSMTLDQPREMATRNLGGGHALWVFNNGTLTNLRTFGKGAFKRDITFARVAGGFTCVANEGFAREEGGGPLVMNSLVDDVPVTIISWKQISSVCRVTKQNPDAH